MQYNQTVSQIGYHPRIVRTDRGKETLLMAELHFALARTNEPGVKMHNCYYYGTSRKNQRIEAWWSQLEKSCLWRWRVSFIYFVRHFSILIIIEILSTVVRPTII